MGASNEGLRPLSAICAQSSTVVHCCGRFGPLSKGNFRHKMTTIVGNRGQLCTSTFHKYLKPPFAKPPFTLSRPKKDKKRTNRDGRAQIGKHPRLKPRRLRGMDVGTRKSYKFISCGPSHSEKLLAFLGGSFTRLTRVPRLGADFLGPFENGIKHTKTCRKSPDKAIFFSAQKSGCVKLWS